MEEIDFHKVSPAIWLVFGGSYLNHDNAPHATPDRREQLLVDLLRSYLNSELSRRDAKQVYGPTFDDLDDIDDLLELWSDDLDFIYKIRQRKGDRESLVRKMAQRFLDRVQNFENCTVIPNGLVSRKHTHSVMKIIDGGHDNVHLAILKKRKNHIDWVQVNPGCAYHQSSPSPTSLKTNAFFEIKEINLEDITEDWLYLLVGLKTIRPGETSYRETSLYECLLVHLNGKTEFQPKSDEGFITSSPISPVHTWQVVHQSFRYLLQHFLGDSYQVTYQRLLTGFKLYLMEKTFDAYREKGTDECHYLLQEMCRDVAQHAVDQGNEEQKAYALKLIDEVKAAIEHHCSQQELQTREKCQLGSAHVSSLSFAAPCVIKHIPSSNDVKPSGLKVEPVFVKPNPEEDIIGYLEQFKFTFMDELINSNHLNEIALLSYGIEVFLIDYLAKTDILKTSMRCPFSRDDFSLASVLIELAETYHRCQAQLVNNFLSNVTYQPHFYTKNVVIQFFVYAAVAALNYRDECIGPTLETHNLSVATSKTLSFIDIIPHLIVQDRAWLKVIFTLKTFFKQKEGKNNLFCFEKFQYSKFTFEIANDAEEKDTDVMFAYQLLKTDEDALARFVYDYRNLDDEKFNRKWQELTYTDNYLPPIYGLLSKVAHFAKVSLTGFFSGQGNSAIKIGWSFNNSSHVHGWGINRKCFWRSRVSFQMKESTEVSTKPNQNQLTSYVLKGSDPYQRLIVNKENIGKPYSHYMENEIIASQNEKPNTMDCTRYMQLGFLQSEPHLKLERLYIALKEKHLDFGCEAESVLIKQALFEVSVLKKPPKRKVCSLLEWTVSQNLLLIHKLGLLCIEKVWAMEHRLTQHHAIGNILEVILALLTFYPPGAHKDEFIEGITNIYYLLKKIIAKSAKNVSNQTLLYLNAYLIISIQGKPELLETEMLTVLKALMAIHNYKAEGVELDNLVLLRVRISSIIWTPWFEHYLEQDQTLLNDLIANVIPRWDQEKVWQKSNAGLLFTCGEHVIKPLLGGIYFQNQPVMGLPDTITEHQVFKEYFDGERFMVFPYFQDFNNHMVPCYLSNGRRPMTRLTLIEDALLIEESINGHYQRYIPAEELLGHSEYPAFLKQSPRDQKPLRHWLDSNQRILIKDQQRQIVYKWCLGSNELFSSQNQGYVVPWDHLQGPLFKAWMERIELPSWIEIIAQRNSANFVEFQSLHFPRLGLHFDVKHDAVYCRQIHGYVLAYEQHINTLHGFLNYFIMEKEELNLTRCLLKVVIPHWQVTPSASLIAKTAIVNRTSVQSPTYFVYDFDPKTGLLKAQHTRGQLYLALLYYCTASMDNHDLSNCNAFHLARENLEVCWKDQPYDEVELSIIDQFLSPEAMRDFHCNRIALYLKVVSLLSSSLRLAFLHTGEGARKSKDKSKNLLRKCGQHLPFLLSVYLENKSTIFKRIRLSVDEEEDVIKQCLSTSNILENFEEPEKSRITSQISIIEEYSRLNFEQSSQVDLSAAEKKSYKKHYSQLFSKKLLRETNFLHDLDENLSEINFVSVEEEVNFSSGFSGILFDLFRLNDFIPLYNLAKSSTVSTLKYRYLLHHMVFRAKMNYDRFPFELVMMLARALLLVAENPDLFPEPPDWFGVSEISVELSNRRLTGDILFMAFPPFSWCPPETYDTYEEEETAMKKAEADYNSENDQIWSKLAKYDLSNGIPNELPDDPYNFILLYERFVTFKNTRKRDIVRILYSKAAHNDAMYQFFVKVLQQCDAQKWDSAMGWNVTPFVDNPITETFMKEKPSPPTSEQVSLEDWAIPPQPLIFLDTFFTSVPRQIEKKDFLFNDQLKKPESKFQRQFYKELNDSWTLYHNETEFSYSWRKPESMSLLERTLQNKYRQVREQANLIWGHIAAQLKQRPNSESDNYFALRWHSGQVSHYHKGDILRLLVGPNELASYNPDCVEKFKSIIQSLLNYVIYEIDATKIIRVLTFIEQFKHSKNEVEQDSVLQDLVRSLQENLDPTSFRYPHWFLFQLENEIIVRENQRELIEAMLNQTEKAMYQLNMGEGKSSVILPLLSINLANGQQLLRINVLAPLLITMKNFLCQRFSGLIRKRIYTLPFHRDTNISPKNLTLVFQALQTCIDSQHVLLVTPEHRLCLQLKIRELLLENQQQAGATNIFNWQTYRQRVPLKIDVYKDLTETEIEELVASQDENLRTCLIKEKYIDADDSICNVPPRGQGHKEFARFKEIINGPNFREWSCLKAAYQELLYNSRLAHIDSSEKLARLHEISALMVIDLLDESDEILRHGTELNYTIGDKFMFAGEELRWQIPQFFIQAIFCDPELRHVIAKGKAYGFTVLNENYSPRGGVPFIQLLYASYFKDYIKPLLIEKFLSENLPTLRKYLVDADSFLVEDEVISVRQYITGELSSETEKKVMSFLADKDQLRNKLLIAKGWLSHGILYHVFNAKYRVQYGLNRNFQGHVTKSIAIPFMGKDTPSPRSEFSHPDVMLGFTIISYLYEGLSPQQLKDSLTRLKDKFSPKVVEDRLKDWVEAGQAWIDSQAGSSASLLESFEQMDLADEHCLKKLYQYLSGNHLAIFFYLNEFVLLQDAMQYLYKISANAHSLVGYDAALGFSGTDDRKLTMPFQVKSLCSETQAGTNGKLLSVLQQERNSRYYSLQVEDTNSLLEQLCLYVTEQPNCHALIDAGALVTGLTNLEVASFLCEKLPSKFQGILYFSDKGNSLTVLTRDDKTIALQDCYLDKQDLFAYLDDIHTRGTDIQLPLNCHAILTVSMGMEKDKLMQAAMRLRQLAQKQSVSLWSTQAVTLAIARDNSISPKMIDSSEVIKWVTRNTINHISTDLLPVAVRKINFQFLKRAEAWLKEAPTKLVTLIQHCQEKEMFSLEDFYGYTPQCQNLADWLARLLAVRERAFWCEIEEEMQKKQLTDSVLYEKIFKRSDEKKFKKDLDTIYNEFKDYLGEGIMHSSLDNDQEKEIEVEVEIIHEQEVLADVEKRRAHPENTWDVQLILRSSFIVLAQVNQIIMPLTKLRNFIKMPANLKNIVWHEDVYMTDNFINSIKVKPSETIDNYLRPVDTMLIHRRLKGKTRIILLSGREAAEIKKTCYEKLDDKILLTHLYDIDGPTQLPADQSMRVSKQEQKLLTIIKLFAGECHYPSSAEVRRVAKRVGRLYPDYFTHLNVPIYRAYLGKLYGILIQEGYLDSSGIMTKKLLKILDNPKPRELPILEYMSEFPQYRQYIMQKLQQVYTKLIIEQSRSLKGNHNTLRQWVGTRGRLREYVGSALESILNSEYQLKCSSKNL